MKDMTCTFLFMLNTNVSFGRELINYDHISSFAILSLFSILTIKFLIQLFKIILQ